MTKFPEFCRAMGI